MAHTTLVGRTSSGEVDPRDIDAVIDRLIDGWNSHDPVAFAAPFADDAEFVAWFGALYTGRAEIEGTHRHAFTTVHADSIKTVVENRIRVLASDAVAVRCESSLTGVRDRHGALEPDMQERWIMVMKRLDVGWRIVEAQNTYIAAWLGAPPSSD